MMVRFFGRTSLRQYLPSKPDRYGIKLWALCAANGYLFDLDIYCGKSCTRVEEKLSSCALGSRVVLQMLDQLLKNVSKKKLAEYHLYIDNFFTSPDLLLHLKKIGMRSTGTLRKNRIKKQHKFEKKDARGTYKVHYDQNSGVNYISVIDSKPVSLLSTAAGVSPMMSVKRYSSNGKNRIEYQFPFAFSIYNKFMGGVDVHDYRCKRVSMSINSKKWTWAIATRILQSSITNATIIWNVCNGDEKKKMSTKEMCMKVSEAYLSISKLSDFRSHKYESKERRTCSYEGCTLRTTRFCMNCQKYYCLNCFSKLHSKSNK